MKSGGLPDYTGVLKGPKAPRAPRSTITTIAGVDPGTIRIGVCVLQVRGNELKRIHLDAFGVNPKTPKHERLWQLYKMLLPYLEGVDEVVIEKAYVGRNAASAIAIGEARGMVIIAAAGRFTKRPKVIEYTASEARKAVCGSGDRDKIVVRQFVKRILNLDHFTRCPDGSGTELPLDASDAACLAIARAWEVSHEVCCPSGLEAVR